MSKDVLKKWLSEKNTDLFATVTLKQAIKKDDGTYLRICSDDIRRTAWLLRDRFLRSIHGRKQAKIEPFLVFVEGDGLMKRYHLHIALNASQKIPLEEFTLRFKETAGSLEWVFNEIDVRPIDAGTSGRVISYSLKEGISSFLPEASNVP